MKQIFILISLVSISSLNLNASKLIPKREWGYSNRESLAIKKLQLPFYGGFSREEAKKKINLIPFKASEEETYTLLVQAQIEEKPAHFLALILKNNEQLITLSSFLKFYAEIFYKKPWKKLLETLENIKKISKNKKPIIQFREELDLNNDDSDSDSETGTTEPWGSDTDDDFKTERIEETYILGSKYYTFRITDKYGEFHDVNIPKEIVDKTTNEEELQIIIFEKLYKSTTL